MRLAVAVVMIGLAGPAWAGALEEKACILAAAEKLPAIPGLRIMSASAAPDTAANAVPRIVSSFSTATLAAQTLDRTFSILNSVPVKEQIVKLITDGADFAARRAIAEAVLPRVSGAAIVSIGVKAAGQDATYGFACAYDTVESVVAAPVALLQ